MTPPTIFWRLLERDYCMHLGRLDPRRTGLPLEDPNPFHFRSGVGKVSEVELGERATVCTVGFLVSPHGASFL